MKIIINVDEYNRLVSLIPSVQSHERFKAAVIEAARLLECAVEEHVLPASETVRSIIYTDHASRFIRSVNFACDQLNPKDFKPISKNEIQA